MCAILAVYTILKNTQNPRSRMHAVLSFFYLVHNARLLIGREGVYMIHSSSRAETKMALSVCVEEKVKHFILFRNKVRISWFLFFIQLVQSFIRLSIHPFIHFSIHLSTHPPFIYSFFHPSIRSSTLPSIHYQFIFIYFLINQFSFYKLFRRIFYQEGFALDPNGPRFKNKRNLLDYYHDNPLPNQDIGKLKQPYTWQGDQPIKKNF